MAQYSTARQGIALTTLPLFLRYQFVVPGWVQTSCLCKIAGP